MPTAIAAMAGRYHFAILPSLGLVCAVAAIKGAATARYVWKLDGRAASGRVVVENRRDRIDTGIRECILADGKAYVMSMAFFLVL